MTSTEDRRTEDLRRAVLASVTARTPIDERERTSIAECRRQLAGLATPFDRHADPVHVTGSGLVTGPRGVLLLNHRKLHIWVQPGGHLEPGETPWAAARRESEEETGLQLAFASAGEIPDLLHVDVHPSAAGHTHLDLRYGLIEVGGDDEPRPPQGESQQVVWYSWADALDVADPGLAGLLRHLHPAGCGDEV